MRRREPEHVGENNPRNCPDVRPQCGGPASNISKDWDIGVKGSGAE